MRRTDSKLGLSYDRANPEGAHPGFGKLLTTARSPALAGKPWAYSSSSASSPPGPGPLVVVCPPARPWHGQDLWRVAAASHTNGDTASVRRHLTRSCRRKGWRNAFLW